MKTTGIVRKVDELGRIVLAVELRRTLDIETGTPLELFVDDDMIMLRKYNRGCLFCGEMDDLVDVKGKKVCRECLDKIKQAKAE